MNTIKNMKTRISLHRTRHALRNSLLCGWILATGLPLAVQSQNYSTPYTFTTIAGNAGTAGIADGTNNGARFDGLYSLAADGAGNLYGVEFGANTIRKATLDGTNWVVTTLAGGAGLEGSADGTNSAARFNGPSYLALDSATNIYVTDYYNQTIRKVAPVGTNWVVTTLAGKAGLEGSADGTNSAARFNGPNSVSIDSLGNFYVADNGSDTIRKVTPVGTNWVVTTLAGKPGVTGSADGTGSAARFNFTAVINGQSGGTVVVDSAGNLYVPDYGNYTIRKGTPPLIIGSSGSGFGVNGGQFGFALTGPSGQSVVVESSTDLVNWLPLWTNTLTFPAALTFSDPQIGVNSNRFYRAFTQ